MKIGVFSIQRVDSIFHLAFSISHFSFSGRIRAPMTNREFNLEVQQLLFEKYFIWGLETETLARTIV